MATRDFHSVIQSRIALNQQPIAVGGTTLGFIMDTSFFESIEFSVQGGVLVNSNFQLLLEDGNDPNLSDAAPVATEFLIGDPSATITTTNGLLSLGYVGHKRFVRPSIFAVVGAGGSIQFIGIIMIGDSVRHFPFVPLA